MKGIPLNPVEIHILIVADGELRLGDSTKGLEVLFKNLTTAIEPWVQCIIWPAHRESYWDPKLANWGTKAGFINQPIFNFRFLEDMPVWHGQTLMHHITKIDQIWLMGQSRSDPILCDCENTFIGNFMAAGGGVFATGDHEDQGIAMCARIPRVKHMRNWEDVRLPQEDPEGFTVHDSIRPLTEQENIYTSKERLERDGIGKTLFPRTYKKYQRPAPPAQIPPDLKNAFVYPIHTRPHPLLSSRNPFETYLSMLPDHRHEGRVKTFNEIPPGECEDWPTPPDEKKRLFWDVIASTPNVGVRRLSQRNPARKETRLSEYGVVGAYDGFIAETGRIVVDSTFHHHVNYNLLPAEFKTKKRKRIRKVFENPGDTIYLLHALTYQRNIALWLCPWEKQQQLSALAVWYVVGRLPLWESLDQIMYPWRAGKLVLNVLSDILGEPFARHLWTYFFDRRRLTDIFSSFHMASSRTLEILDEYIIGEVALRLKVVHARTRRGQGIRNSEKLPLDQIRDEAIQAAADAIQQFACDLLAHVEDYAALVRTIFKYYPKEENPESTEE